MWLCQDYSAGEGFAKVQGVAHWGEAGGYSFGDTAGILF
jgi:hypothetical protein